MACNEEETEISLGYSNGQIANLDLRTGYIRQEWQAHNGSVFKLRYVNGGDNLVSGCRDERIIQTWKSVNTSQPILFDRIQTDSFIFDFQVCEDGHLMVSSPGGCMSVFRVSNQG